jgi:hypothetical protein
MTKHILENADGAKYWYRDDKRHRIDGPAIAPGCVGIKVNQWGSQKGVNDFPLVTGGV